MAELCCLEAVNFVEKTYRKDGNHNTSLNLAFHPYKYTPKWFYFQNLLVICFFFIIVV